MDPRTHLPEPIAHGLALILDTYCDWVNSFNHPNNHEWDISPTSYLDPPYGYVNLDLTPYHTYDYIMWSLTVDNGDDGGPQGLTVWWGYDYDKGATLYDADDTAPEITDEDWDATFTALCHMTQTFDTLLSVVVSDRVRLDNQNVPPYRTSSTQETTT